MILVANVDALVESTVGVAARLVPCCSDSFFEFGKREMMAMPPFEADDGVLGS
jgi:hypothetical protein